MKINKLLVVILVTLLSCHRNDDSQLKKEELKNVLLDYYKALSKKDFKKISELTTANFILFEDGIVYNNAGAVKAIELMKPFTVTFTFDSLNVHMDKKDASAYYFRNADFIFDDSVHLPARFLESATFNKEDNKWKLRFLHSSSRR
jgi:SnoaL-like domain